MTISESNIKFVCRLNRKGLWRCGIMVACTYGNDRRRTKQFKHLSAAIKIKEGRHLVFTYPVDYYKRLEQLIRLFTLKHPELRMKRKRIYKQREPARMATNRPS